LALKRVAPAGRQRLLSYIWPGNVRELAHELERAIVFTDSEELNFENLQTPIGADQPPGQSGWFNASFRFPAQGFDLASAIAVLIRPALKQSGENVSAAARLLGVSRDYLRYRLSEKKTDGHAGS